MALTTLPTELFDKIIQHSLPEGFESLALTCKGIHKLCKPFIAHHNELSARFRTFDYNLDEDIKSAWGLINRIAIEPIVALYIQHAIFREDSHNLDNLTRVPVNIQDLPNFKALIELFASSSVLEKAGVNWKEFYATVKQEFEGRNSFYYKSYSQSAFVFLQTLLPNLKSIALPRGFNTNNLSTKIYEAMDWESQHPNLLEENIT